jgi:hypothetical protein
MSSAMQLEQSDYCEQLKTEKFTIPLSNSMALEVYSNQKPFNLKIASLQKGLILVYKGVERIGEGTGFGFPALIYPKETYFSGSSTFSVKQTANSIRITKEFHMDRTARNKFRNAQLENQKARAFIRHLTDLYQKNKHLRFLSLKEFIVNKGGIESTFIETTPIGKISVTYDISGYFINVKVDFSHLKREQPQKIFILNEQSASFFRKYSDAQHTSLIDEQIGAWDTVNSDWACLTDLQGKVGYRLWNVNGSVLRRGREIMKDSMDWVGLDYEVNPFRGTFEYKIEILGANG